MSARIIDLAADELAAVDAAAGARVRVERGSVWLTEEGRLQDLFIGTGREEVLTSGRRALIEGIGPARVVVIPPDSPAWERALRRFLRQQ
ncbi:MAG: DUF2917 domain-containing protein [Betaproteobacteria bacterium]